MKQPSKVTQYLASALLAGLILPVSLMAQFQSAVAAGSVTTAKGERAAARADFDESKAALRAARQAYNADQTAEKKAAVNAAVQAKQAEKNDLIQARIEVLKAKVRKVGGSEADIAALSAAAANAEGIATQIAALDLNTPEGREQGRILKEQLDLASRTRVVSAINQAKVETAETLVDKIRATIQAAEGGSEMVSECAAQFSEFQRLATAARTAYGAVGTANAESVQGATTAASNAWKAAKTAWGALGTCTLRVAGVNNYESCVAEGGNITQTSTSTPEKCRIYGRTFSNAPTTTSVTPAGSGGITNDSACTAQGGTCGNPATCDGKIIPNLCTGGQDNKCCIPDNTSSCASQGGTCTSSAICSFEVGTPTGDNSCSGSNVCCKFLPDTAIGGSGGCTAGEWQKLQCGQTTGTGLLCPVGERYQYRALTGSPGASACADVASWRCVQDSTCNITTTPDPAVANIPSELKETGTTCPGGLIEKAWECYDGGTKYCSSSGMWACSCPSGYKPVKWSPLTDTRWTCVKNDTNYNWVTGGLRCIADDLNPLNGGCTY